MSIADHLETAEDLMRSGKVSAALALTLICIAAASRKVSWCTGGDGAKFRQYIRTRLTGDLIFLDGKRVDLERTLYGVVRNDLIHEGKTDELVFDQKSPHALSIHNGKVTFGAEFVWILIDVIRHDPELRDEFKAKMLPTENIVQLLDFEKLEQAWLDLNEASRSVGFVAVPRIWEMFVRAYTPERLQAGSHEQIREFYGRYVLHSKDVTGLHAELSNPNWSARLLTGGLPSNLATTFAKKIAPLFRTHERIEERGKAVIPLE